MPRPQNLWGGVGKKIGPLKQSEKEACKYLVISIIDWPELERRAGLSARRMWAGEGAAEATSIGAEQILLWPGLTFGSFGYKGTGFAPFATKRRRPI